MSLLRAQRADADGFYFEAVDGTTCTLTATQVSDRYAIEVGTDAARQDATATWVIDQAIATLGSAFLSSSSVTVTRTQVATAASITPAE